MVSIEHAVRSQYEVFMQLQLIWIRGLIAIPSKSMRKLVMTVMTLKLAVKEKK